MSYYPGNYYSPDGSPPGALTYAPISAADAAIILRRRRNRVAPVIPIPPVRDRMILAAISDALVTTGEFDHVTTGGLPENGNPFSAEIERACVLELGRPTENEVWSDFVTASFERVVPFSATIMFREEDPDPRYDEADRLFCLVANTVASGNPWLSLTSIRKTRMINGEWIKTAPPEQRYKITGQFVYIISSPNGRLATD